MESLANAVRSAGHRRVGSFGRPTSLAVTLRIIDARTLTFADVARPVDVRDDAEGSTGAGQARARGGPTGDGGAGSGGRER